MADARPPARSVVLARAVRAKGLRGEVLFRGDPEALELITPGAVFELRTADAVRSVTVRGARPSGDGVAIALDGVSDRTGAEALVSATLEVDRDRLPPPTPARFFWEQALGLVAITPSGVTLGRIEDRVRTPAQTVFVIRSGTREVLLPAVPAFVKAFQLEEGRVVVDPPEGLIELGDAS